LGDLERLQSQSSLFRFTPVGETFQGIPDTYLLRFEGEGLSRSANTGEVQPQREHVVRIHLGPHYPRAMPDLQWITPMFHPNISASGVVCLGGFGTHWAPGVTLPVIIQMLWNMIRYANVDIRSPYNRDAVAWIATQPPHRFPLDPRPLRDQPSTELQHPRPQLPDQQLPDQQPTAQQQREPPPLHPQTTAWQANHVDQCRQTTANDRAGPDQEIVFLDSLRDIA
jgi:hypothetical protein